MTQDGQDNRGSLNKCEILIEIYLRRNLIVLLWDAELIPVSILIYFSEKKHFSFNKPKLRRQESAPCYLFDAQARTGATATFATTATVTATTATTATATVTTGGSVTNRAAPISAPVPAKTMAPAMPRHLSASLP